MIEEPKPTVVPAAVAAPQAIPAIVDPAKATDAVVLSQAPAVSATDAKPVVDKPSSVVAPTISVAK
jgi:hypothetical protein